MDSRRWIKDGVGRRTVWKRGLVGSALSLPLLLACAGPQVIPQEYQDEVDRDITFLQVKENPTAFQGRLLVIGGMVLSAKVMKAGTRITIVGEVTGASTLPLGEVEYAYPVLAVKSLTVWRGHIPPYGPHASPYAGAYWRLYWGPWPAVPERDEATKN